LEEEIHNLYFITLYEVWPDYDSRQNESTIHMS